MNIKEAIFGSQPGGTAPLPVSNDLQGWCPIADIKDGVLCTRDGGYVKLLEVLPVNFFLQNEEGRNRIVADLASYLRIAPDTLQILCLSQPVDTAHYAQRMEEYALYEQNARCRDAIRDNIAQVQSMTHSGAYTQRFFLAFRFEPQMAPNAKEFGAIADALYDAELTARAYIGRCGTAVVAPQYADNLTAETVYGMLCKRTSRYLRLPLYFRLMLKEFHGTPQQVFPADPEPGSKVEAEAEAEIKAEAEPVPSDKIHKKKRKPRKKETETTETNTPRGGETMLLDLLCPPSADLTHRDYVELDGVLHSYLYIAGYGYQTLVSGGWLACVVGAGEGVSVSFTLQRQQREKILPKVSQSIMWSRSRMQDVGDTRADYEELDSAIHAGQYIKDSMNRYGEDYYDMFTLIEVTADTQDELHRRVQEVERLCASQDIVCKRCEYTEEQAFRSFLPIVRPDPAIARKARRNVLTSGAAAAFPFSSFEICEQDGILIGENLHGGSLCMLDIFNSSRYSNANMTILGMSGAGKTYLLQLIAMRYRQQGVQVFIIAPYKGHEYRPACEAIGGRYIKFAPSSPDCINFLEIRRESLDVDAELSRTETRNDSLLADKISRLHIYFSLLRRSMTEDDKSRLDTELVRLYERFGITRDNDSLLLPDGSPKRQPTARDLYELLQEREELRPLASSLSRFVGGSAKSLGGATNVDLNNKYIVLDISEIGKDLRPFGAMLAADICLDYCKRSRREKKIIILDECWTLIGAGSNALAAEFVMELFKTVRSYSAAAIAASQDLEDFFALENGKFGKALLNNSSIKFALMTEPEEGMLIQQHYHLTDEEMNMHRSFERGYALLCAGRNRIGVHVVASPREHELITTDPRDIERMHHRQKIEALQAERREEYVDE